MTRRRNVDAPGRRASDGEGWRWRIRYFWQIWGRDVWLVATTIVAVWAAILGYQAAADADDAIRDAGKAQSALAETAAKAALQAQEQCERSKKLTPPFIKLLQDARARDVLSGKDVRLYKDIVPKEC